MLLTITFLICAALAVAGALLAAAGGRSLRFLGLVLTIAATAAMLALLSALFAALVELVAGLASAVLLSLAPAPAAGPVLARSAPAWPAQLAAAGCAALLALLLVAAWRGGVASGSYPGGIFNTAAIGRLLFDRDGLAAAAAGGLLLAGIAGAAASWRVTRR